MTSEFTSGNLKEICRLVELGPHGRTQLKWVSEIYNGRARTGLIWLRIGANVGLL
jgi:hypothetical protein